MATVIPRSDHPISRSQLPEHALKVLYRLKKAGYASYFVGGGVRDLLLGLEPKDFDVATDARPEEVKRLFRNSRLIGRRFRLAHIRFGREIVEVATFRGGGDSNDKAGQQLLDESGKILRDNLYGSLEEDAFRRDFTVNALYYNIADFSVVDYVGGLADIKVGKIRAIGDPATRYREDPVRMLRALRFAVKLGFRIDADTAAPMAELASLLEDIPAARLYEEVQKMFLAGKAVQTFEMLRHYDLFRYLFPLTELALTRQQDDFPLTFLARALQDTDTRIAQEQSVTPAFLYAALLWEPVRQRMESLEAGGVSSFEALHRAVDEVSGAQQQHASIPRRFGVTVREIFHLQLRLANNRGKRALRALAHPRFRAAYDFLVLRAKAGEADQALADWWTQVQEENAPQQRAMIEGGSASRKRPRRRRPRRSKVNGND